VHQKTNYSPCTRCPNPIWDRSGAHTGFGRPFDPQTHTALLRLDNFPFDFNSNQNCPLCVMSHATTAATTTADTSHKQKQSPTIRLSSCQSHTLATTSTDTTTHPSRSHSINFRGRCPTWDTISPVQQRQCVQLYKRLVADYDFVLPIAWLWLRPPAPSHPISQSPSLPQLPAYLTDT